MTDRPDDYGSDVQLPDVYGPVIVGGGTDYEMELTVSEPFRYAAGFETVLTPEEALETMNAIPGEWRLTEPPYSDQSRSRIEHRFEDAGATDAIPPPVLAPIVADDGNPIRYVVPVYKSAEFGSTAFTPVPNRVVVSVLDESVFDQVDGAALTQGFSPVSYRDRFPDADRVDGGTFTRIYSSFGSEEEERYPLYTGEPGPALWLIEHLMSLDVAADAGLVAEPDWYIAYPNDLGNGAAQSADDSVASHGQVDQVAMHAGGVKVAVLDGEFDLNHASGKLPFGQPRVNVMDDNDEVDAVNNHAHGTLCAGVIGAQSGIQHWLEGGVEPAADMIPISIYRAVNQVPVELEHLVEGINDAAAHGCRVISISVAGYPAANTLIRAVAEANDAGAVIVAGTGNREEGAFDRAGFVLYPAKFGNVIAVGAAINRPSDPLGPLRRVSIRLSGEEDELVRWESRHGTGIDVVAPGLCVTSTDISGPDGASKKDSPVGDIWNRFSGTSAATPLVAGFAAKIARRTGGSPQQIRNAIRDAAVRLGPYEYARTRFGRPWDWRVGFGWIDHTIIDGWEPTQTDDNSNGQGSNKEGLMTGDTTETNDSEIGCGPSELFVDVSDDEASYRGKFGTAITPLADFLASLASTDEYCCTMGAHFWRDPYRTARIAGLPWSAAVLLGSGDWQAVYEAVDVELHRVENPGGPGPIWVRVR